jgi:2-iminobutanoate/2-iminopropanoate deaminase
MGNVTRVITPFSYSSAVVAGDFVFLGLHRGFGERFEDQMRGALEAIGNTLQGLELGLSLEHLVKVNVWLKRIQDLPEMEKLFRDYFAEGQFPARMTATTEFIDTDCLVMIDGVAYKN